MNLLYANDAPGQYPPSWYADSTPALAPFDSLKGEVKADVCVIGAGYTGLSAALHLAKAGRRVVVLEAHRVGFGASGRNGGQLGSGQRVDQDALEKMVGKVSAKALWDMGEDAKNLVKSLIHDHKIDCHLKPGVAWTASSRSDVAHLHDYAEGLNTRYGYGDIETLDAAQCHAICPSPDYKGGVLDMGAAHLHPLAFALGLARAAKEAGVQIFERSHVQSLEYATPATVRTQTGQVIADHVILACNGYLSGLAPSVSARVMPINNFIVATEPLGERVSAVLNRDIAVADSRFVVNYFRLSHDGRLLFGGGESYGYRFPKDIAATVRKPLQIVFPHLKDVKIDYAWGGTLGITMKRFPYLTRVAPNVLSASGYSGHGVGTATHAGRIMAQAIQGQSDGFDTMGAIATPSFPGGSAMRTPLLILAMTWYALRDRLGL
ncbi:Gamma-glutamylputrescine oxidoreductase [Roseobacter fucihabitans]|uniref:Gamma-glutamylputrescine oxidoreductase n=1 Tax=Roseobacter fucihabitans TaxID=1537242 RepID=A0ABZ2BP31_9RHOB|nr:FAD-binding oxidoreductase [Roseobacter litoralis]MBC6966028.1 Gamma-glutamylputrescine oxidoreductase [Roseobacter litoralis]